MPNKLGWWRAGGRWSLLHRTNSTWGHFDPQPMSGPMSVTAHLSLEVGPHSQQQHGDVIGYYPPWATATPLHTWEPCGWSWASTHPPRSSSSQPGKRCDPQCGSSGFLPATGCPWVPWGDGLASWCLLFHLYLKLQANFRQNEHSWISTNYRDF